MMSSRSGRLAVLALLVCGCAHTAPAPQAAHKRPVVVTIVIDQLAAWIAEERLPLLPDSGGFARLRREGVWARDMRYAHAITETAPGHASLYTACAPWKSGIVANETIDAAGHLVPYLFDPPSPSAAHVIGPDGPTSTPTVSLAHLECETVADRLRAAVPAAQIVSLSFKDRAAVLPAGRHADAALWFDTHLDSFATTSALADVFPAWVKPFADKAACDKAQPTLWTLLDPAFVQAHALCPDGRPGEADVYGLGTVFPHPVKGPQAFRETPFADSLLLDVGAAVLGNGDGDSPLLLELSLSSNDLIGHAFGPESWEAWDELLRLDAALGHFLSQLDAAVGPQGWSLILSADHGVPEMPERAGCSERPWCKPGAPGDRWQRTCASGQRIAEEPLLSQLRIATELALGKGAWVLGIVDPYVVLTPMARALPPERRSKLDHALRAVLARQPGVASVFEVAAFPQPCPPESDDSIPALVCRSVQAGVVGDYYVVTQPGSFFGGGHSDGVGHGAPYLFDRSVPLLARIPGKLPAGVVVDGPVPFETFARTVALALGLDFPASASGTALEAAKPSASSSP